MALKLFKTKLLILNVSHSVIIIYITGQQPKSDYIRVFD